MDHAFAPLHQRGGKRNDQQRDTGQRDQRTVPADVGQQPLRERQHRELAERARRRRDAERHAALLGRKLAAEHAGHHAEGHAGQADAQQHARRQHEQPRRRREGHGDQAQHVQRAAPDQYAGGAVLVGDHAGERLRHAPHQVLHRERQRERFAAPAQVGRNGLQEQSEAVPDAHGDGEDQAAADENDGRGAPIGCGGGHG